MDPEQVRQGWANRSGRFSPTYYAHLGGDTVTETLVRVLELYLDSDARILEIGCGSGRHLSALYDAGFDNLVGIDINPEAFAVMEAHYPAVAESGTFHTGAIEDVLPTLADDAVDVLYSVETLQHIHPDAAWVFDDIARVTTDVLITAENEGNAADRGESKTPVSYVDDDFPLYHRNWHRIFSNRGFAQLICEPTEKDTIRVFRKV